MPTYDGHFFERLYETQDDPWHFRDSAYEREKYQATVSSLPTRRYRQCLELGCSIGELTRLLAEKCDAIVALDISQTALAQAKETCEGLSVDFRRAALPEGDLGHDHDLVVASEILYYLDSDQLKTLAARLSNKVRPHAVCVTVHWTGATDYPLSGDAATCQFAQYAALEDIAHQRYRHYRLDVWQFPNTHGVGHNRHA